MATTPAQGSKEPPGSDSPTPRKGQKRQAKSMPSSSTPSSSHKKRKAAAPRSTPIKNNDAVPTWVGDAQFAGKSADLVANEAWMTGYLSFNSKFSLRNLAISGLVLPYAVEHSRCAFTATELHKALTLLMELPAEDEDDPFGNDAQPRVLNDFGEIKAQYVEPTPGADANRKGIPDDQRVELLARMLLTVRRNLEWFSHLTGGGALEKMYPGKFQSGLDSIIEHIKLKEEMPYFRLPAIHAKDILCPALGPLTFGDKTEHAVEPFYRVQCLFRYANSKMTKSKYTMASCLGATLGKSEADRLRLSEAEVQRLIDNKAEEWLGRKEHPWPQELDNNSKPKWMRPDAGVQKKERVLGIKTADDREIVFEAIWLEELDENTAKACRAAWNDPTHRQSYHVARDAKHPQFVENRVRVRVSDLRKFKDFPSLRDRLRVDLGLLSWKLDFEELFYVGERVEASSFKDPNDFPKSAVPIYHSSGARPSLSYKTLLERVDKGPDAQTLAFVCRPLSGEDAAYYPWETAVALEWDDEVLGDGEGASTTTVEKCSSKTATEEVLSDGEGASTTTVEKCSSKTATEEDARLTDLLTKLVADLTTIKDDDPAFDKDFHQFLKDYTKPTGKTTRATVQNFRELVDRNYLASITETKGTNVGYIPVTDAQLTMLDVLSQLKEQVNTDDAVADDAVADNAGADDNTKTLRKAVAKILTADPLTSSAIKKAEDIGDRLEDEEQMSTHDMHLDLRHMSFETPVIRLAFFAGFNIDTNDGLKAWGSHVIEKVLQKVKYDARSETWGNERWVKQGTRAVSRENKRYIDATAAVANDSREADAALEGDEDTAQKKTVMPTHEPVNLAQNASRIAISSDACLGPPLEPCLKAMQFAATGKKHRNTNLALYESPLFLTNSGRAFLPHQVTGLGLMISTLLGKIVPTATPNSSQRDGSSWLAAHIIQTKCALLADSMGLGKTFMAISVLHYQMTYGPKSKSGLEDYRPCLILAPSSEILRIWDKEIFEHYPYMRRIVAANVRVETLAAGAKVVTRKQCCEDWGSDLAYVWDSKNPQAEKTVILSTIETYSSRTLLVDMKAMTLKEQVTGKKEKNIIWRSLWKERGRKFRTVVVDEAHKIRNTHTKSYHGVSETEYESILPVTATPAFIHHKNILALYNVMFPAYKAHMQAQHATDLQWCEKKVRSPATLYLLDDLAINDPRKAYAMKPSIIASLIENPDLTQLSLHMPKIERLFVIRRSAHASIPQDVEGKVKVALRGLLPEVEARTVSIHQDPDSISYSQVAHYGLSIEFNEIMKNFMKSGGAEAAKRDHNCKPNLMDNTRRFLLISSGTNMYRLNDIFAAARNPVRYGLRRMDLLTPTLVKMRRAGVDAFDLANILRMSTDPEWDPENGSLDDMAYILVRGCGPLQVILDQVRTKLLESTSDTPEKILIIEEVNATAFYYERVLQALGIKARVYHAGLTAQEREELKTSFRGTDEHSVMVLILMYRVGGEGLNLDGACQTVIIASPSEGHMKEEQAAYRVIRITTRHAKIEIIRIKVRNSYHEYRESRQVDKLIPDLAGRDFAVADLAGMMTALQRVEVDPAHSSKEGKALIQSENLLIDVTLRAEMIDAQRPLNNDAAGPSNPDDHKRDIDKVEIESSHKLLSPQDKGWTGAKFLTHKTRGEYAAEYRGLDSRVKMLFSHKKNYLRRLLSYPPNKEYTATDMTVAAREGQVYLLEQALENLFKLKSGTREVHHKSTPHIEFDMLPKGLGMALFHQLPDMPGLDDDTDVEDDDEADSEVDDQEVTNEIFFFKAEAEHGFLSQFFQASFTDVNDPHSPVFNNAEQYMHYQKAKVFGDAESVVALASMSDPRKAYARGRKVKSLNKANKTWDSDDNRRWEHYRELVVTHGNRLKFSQNEELRDMLLDTGDSELIEANRYDGIWGIGCTAKQAPSRRKDWGLNLLGKALMKVRAELGESKEKKASEKGKGRAD